MGVAIFKGLAGSLDEPRSKIAVAASLYMVRHTNVRRTRLGEADVVRLLRPECDPPSPTLALR